MVHKIVTCDAKENMISLHQSEAEEKVGRKDDSIKRLILSGRQEGYNEANAIIKLFPLLSDKFQ